MKNATITIRKATGADNVLLAELGAETFRASFGAENTAENMAAYLAAAFSPQIQAAELAEPGSLFLVAEAGGQAVGYARLHVAAPPPCVSGRRPVELVRIYARQAWIGQGVGAALMAACLAEAQQWGCDVIWLGVWQRNPRAIAFYRRWGFTEVGAQTFQLGDDPQTDWVMQRPIQPVQTA